jgi:hypothetical protein
LSKKFVMDTGPRPREVRPKTGMYACSRTIEEIYVPKEYRPV